MRFEFNCLSIYCFILVSRLVIPNFFLHAYHFELLYSVRLPPKLHLTRISRTKKYTSLSTVFLRIESAHSIFFVAIFVHIVNKGACYFLMLAFQSAFALNNQLLESCFH